MLLIPFFVVFRAVNRFLRRSLGLWPKCTAKKMGYSMSKSTTVDFSKELCKKCIAMKTPCSGLLGYQIDTFDMRDTSPANLDKAVIKAIKDAGDEDGIEQLVNALRDYSPSNFSNLNIFLDKHASKMYERRLIMEYELFLGCVGGILALFTGFSFVVLIEFVYFFTVRWFEDWHDPFLSPENFDSNIDRKQPRSNSDPEFK